MAELVIIVSAGLGSFVGFPKEVLNNSSLYSIDLWLVPAETARKIPRFLDYYVITIITIIMIIYLLSLGKTIQQLSEKAVIALLRNS